MPRTQPLSIAERDANLASIRAIPASVLPNGIDRSALIMLCYCRDQEVYAYASGGETYGTWCIWWQNLADMRGDWNGRLTVAQWCEQWQQLVADVGIVLPRMTREDGSSSGGVAAS